MEQPIVERFLPPQVRLSNTIIKIWVDINRLIRGYIVSAIFNVGGQASKDAINADLERVAQELRNLIIQYYSDDIGNQVQADFFNYIYHLEQMIEAYSNNDEKAVSQHRNHLFFFANIYAQSYAVINNYLSRATIETLFYRLVNSVEKQIISAIDQDFVRDIEEYEAFMTIAYRLADEFTYGMLRQFFDAPV